MMLTRDDLLPFAEALAGSSAGEAALAREAQRALETDDPLSALRSLVVLACAGAAPPLTLVTRLLPRLDDWESAVMLTVSVPPPVRQRVLEGLLYDGSLCAPVRPVALALLALEGGRAAIEPLASSLEAKVASVDPTETALLEIAAGETGGGEPARRAALRGYLRSALERGPRACLTADSGQAPEAP